MIFNILLSVIIVSGIASLSALIILYSAKHILHYGECKILINKDPEKAITLEGGSSLLSALKERDIFIPSACGGGGTCGMCKVRVLEGGGPVLVTEESVLSKKEIKNQTRLACQVKIRNDIEIEIPEEIFNVKRYETTVVSNRNVATFIKELVLKLPEESDLDFKAGQYVQIEVPHYEIAFSDFDIDDKYMDVWEKYRLLELGHKNTEPVDRAYSMANYPEEKGFVKLTVRIATPPHNTKFPPGICSTYIFNMKPNDKVSITGPYGDFLIKDTDREMCYIGGGAGMAPMRSHIFHLLKTLKSDRKISFWYGARSAKEIFYDEEYKQLANEFNNFNYTVALSEAEPNDNWEGPKGFIHEVVHELLIKDHSNINNVEFYLCGPEVMIDAVTKMLKDSGVKEEMIAFDKF